MASSGDSRRGKRGGGEIGAGGREGRFEAFWGGGVGVIKLGLGRGTHCYGRLGCVRGGVLRCVKSRTVHMISLGFTFILRSSYGSTSKLPCDSSIL